MNYCHGKYKYENALFNITDICDDNDAELYIQPCCYANEMKYFITAYK